MTNEERTLFIKNRSLETEELLVLARKHTGTLFCEKTYSEFLDLMSKFHRYSFINNLLIQIQFPSASYISGIDTWKMVAADVFGDPDYPIVQPQYYKKGIKILIPFTDTSSDSGSWSRKLIPIPVSVFDIRQVNNLPSPEEELFTIETVDRFLAPSIRSHAPYRMVLTDKTDRVIGAGFGSYFAPESEFIVISDALNETGRTMEYLRTWSLKTIEDIFKEKDLDASYVGFASSSVEYVVRCALGLNHSDIAFNYVSQYASGSSTELWPILHCIQTAAHKIIEKLTDYIEEEKAMASVDWFDEGTLFDYDFLGEDDYEV